MLIYWTYQIVLSKTADILPFRKDNKMSKKRIIEIWNYRYGNAEEIRDYAGRVIKKSACGNPNSKFHPTLDHIRPLSKGGRDILENIIICHRGTNEEKSDRFPPGQLMELDLLHLGFVELVIHIKSIRSK